MSHQINYLNDLPVEPYVDVIISNGFGLSSDSKIGTIDTGSFITIIPKSLIESLQLKVKGKVWNVGGYNTKKEDTVDYDAYFVQITIGSTTFDLLKVIAEDIPDVIIGRDLINLWYLKLNGEKRVGELTPWSINPSDVN